MSANCVREYQRALSGSSARPNWGSSEACTRHQQPACQGALMQQPMCGATRHGLIDSVAGTGSVWTIAILQGSALPSMLPGARQPGRTHPSAPPCRRSRAQRRRWPGGWPHSRGSAPACSAAPAHAVTQVGLQWWGGRVGQAAAAASAAATAAGEPLAMPRFHKLPTSHRRLDCGPGRPLLLAGGCSPWGHRSARR